MRQYILPMAVYVTFPLIFGCIISNSFTCYAITLLATAFLIVFFWQDYSLKFWFGWRNILLGILCGFAVFAGWAILEGVYPLLSQKVVFGQLSFFQSVVRLFGFVLVTPIVEELFARGFFIRVIVSSDWERVKAGTFTWLSFILSVLFFGFAHAEWLQGIVAGIILNLLYYRTKSVETCMLAHSLANILLFVIF
jgi:uncharacterized protein